jgi:hypothetical protein
VVHESRHGGVESLQPGAGNKLGELDDDVLLVLPLQMPPAAENFQVDFWRRSIPADWRQGRGPVDLWHRGAEEGTSVEWRRTSSRVSSPCGSLARPSAGDYFDLPVALVGNFMFR